jgi:hypothetical protein
MSISKSRLPLILLTVVGIAAFSRQAAAQTSLPPDQKSSLSTTFGQAPPISLQLQTIQDTRFAATIKLDGFDANFMAVMKDAKKPEERALVVYTFWHDLALELSALDHQTTRSETKANEIYGEELGPARASWALAITHLAMFEAINAFTKSSPSYKPPRAAEALQVEILREARVRATDVDPTHVDAVEAAVSYAALTTLNQLYPKKQQTIETSSASILNELRGDGAGVGLLIGRAAAIAVLKSRGWRPGTGFTDGSELIEPPASAFVATNGNVGRWAVDPISKVTVALGGNWSRVQPFVIKSSDAFRPGPPPALNSAEFANAFKEVVSLGGDPNVKTDAETMASGRSPTPTTRKGGVDPGATPKTNETFKAIFWGYDGTALLCAPPRLYNMLATTVAREKFKIDKASDFARFLAVVNVAMADAAISAWDAKYHYLFPRPITVIRNASVDDTIFGKVNPTWTPLGAAVTNATASGRNVTPAFPSYPSGHAVFGATLFEILRTEAAARGITKTDFKFMSDEYNGKNYSPGEQSPRRAFTAEFDSFDEAEEENGMSRIWMGIHWGFDKTAGTSQGHAIGKAVSSSLYK